MGAFGVSARERIDRRQIVGVLLGLLLLFLLVTLVVFPPATSDAQVRTSPTSVVASSTATEVVTEQALEVPTDSPSPEPSLESATQEEPTVTITPLPEAPAGMVTVAGGTFKMGGSKGRFDPDETPPHWITLSPYYIDTVEATVAQFARFVASSGHVTEAEQSGSATDWQQFNNPDQQRFPVMRVSWNDATRYCAWFGKRLPTEAEWELASKGHTDRIYPWGDTFASSLANTQEYAAGQPIAIATLGNRSVYGAYDMVGNVWEWVADWYGGGYYASSPSVNPRGPGSGSERVIRGGSFNTQGERATTTVRGKANPAGWSDDIGFRCVRDIPQSEE